MDLKKLLPVLVAYIILLSGLTGTTDAVQAAKKSAASTKNETYDLVIITSRQFSLLLQSFVDHKNNQGITTYVKTTEDIYQEYEGRDQPEKIKFFIKSTIETYQTKFVLLIGGTTVVPTRYTHIYYSGDFGYPTPTQWVFPSDFYYADIYDTNGEFSNWDSNNNNVFAEYAWDGNYDAFDFTPDVNVGRLPCNNDTELYICVQKICTV